MASLSGRMALLRFKLAIVAPQGAFQSMTFRVSVTHTNKVLGHQVRIPLQLRLALSQIACVSAQPRSHTPTADSFHGCRYWRP